MGAATEGLQAAEWGCRSAERGSRSRGVRAAGELGLQKGRVGQQRVVANRGSRSRGKGFPRQRGVHAPRSLFRGSLLPHQARPPQSPVPADPKGTARRGLTGPLASRARRLPARRGELEGRGGPTAVAPAPPQPPPRPTPALTTSADRAAAAAVPPGRGRGRPRGAAEFPRQRTNESCAAAPSPRPFRRAPRQAGLTDRWARDWWARDWRAQSE